MKSQVLFEKNAKNFLKNCKKIKAYRRRDDIAIFLEKNLGK
jgi:hypothetical protein